MRNFEWKRDRENWKGDQEGRLIEGKEMDVREDLDE